MQKISRKTKINFYLFCSLFIFAIAFFPFGEKAIAAENQPADPETNLVNCFQYYSFGSIGISLSPERFTYYPESSITFKGTLENKNNYPVVDGQLFVKLFKRDPQGPEAKNGDFEIAEFSALNNINIDGKKTKEVNFDYSLPKGIANGEYSAQFFFNVSGKYNLAGLSFHNSIPGGTAAFRVASPLEKTIYFDKDNAKLNNKPYGFRKVNETLESNDSIVALVPLKNQTKNTAEIEIQKDVYFWDALNEKGKVDSKVEKISLAAGGSRDISYTIEEPQYSVYLIRFTAKSDAGQSIISIRPTINGIFQPRLNYPALASFPLKTDQKSVIFSCFHNAGSLVKSGKLVLTLKDSEGNIIAEQAYNGAIPSEMVATAKEFIPKKNYAKVVLSASLYDDKGTLVDSSNQNYDCDQFEPSICNNFVKEPVAPIAVEMPLQSSSSAPSVWVSQGGRILWAIIVLIVLAIAGLAAVKLTKKKKNK